MTSHKYWWVFHPTATAYARMWTQIMHDTHRIIIRAGAQGILIYGPSGHGEPILSRSNGIQLGGSARQGLHRQPLLLPAPHLIPEGSRVAARGSADTGGHPYDAVVATILLRCHRLLGKAFALRSTNTWDTERPHRSAAAGLPSARDLYLSLFGSIPAGQQQPGTPQPSRNHPGRNHDA